MDDIQSNKGKTYCLLTVDGDLRIGEPEQQIIGINALRNLYAELGLTGTTSWFINELDFHWTENFEDILIDLVASGEAIGVHDHLDTYFAEDFKSAFNLMKRAKDRLEAFFTKNNIPQRLEFHRNGCAHQREEYYRAAIELGYRIVSDVWPETKWTSRMVNRDGEWIYLDREDEGAILMDNSTIPLGTLPWQHNHTNWLDINSQAGPLLQLPITSMPWIEKERVEAALASDQPYRFLLFDIHPYDLQSRESGKIDREKHLSYRNTLAWLIEVVQPKFVNVTEYAEIFKTAKERT
jgi:hypothetical protein